jgi:hypothetical protein
MAIAAAEGATMKLRHVVFAAMLAASALPLTAQAHHDDSSSSRAARGGGGRGRSRLPRVGRLSTRLGSYARAGDAAHSPAVRRALQINRRALAFANPIHAVTGGESGTFDREYGLNGAASYIQTFAKTDPADLAQTEALGYRLVDADDEHDPAMHIAKMVVSHIEYAHTTEVGDVTISRQETFAFARQQVARAKATAVASRDGSIRAARSLRAHRPRTGKGVADQPLSGEVGEVDRWRAEAAMFPTYENAITALEAVGKALETLERD